MTELGLTWEREQLNSRQYRHIQHLKPIAYRDGSTFRRIVSDWGDSGISARPHIATASQLMCSVGDDGMRRIHPTREADRYVEIGAPFVKIGGTWRKVGFSNTVRQGNLLAWTRPEANLAIWHAGHYVKLGMELKGGYVPEDGMVAFPVGLQGLTRQGGRILAGGQTVALLRAPVAYDAANESDVRPIGWQFATLNSQPYLLLTLPSLAGMVRPVVDPTLTLQPDDSAGQDTFITSNSPDTNWGVARALWSGGSGATADTITRAQMRFDLSTLAGMAIESAELSLVAIEGANATMTAHRALTQWYEGDGTGAAPSGDGSTWNYRNHNSSVAWAGGAGGAAGSDWATTATDSQTSISNVFTLDVAADVQAFADGTPNYGWWLRVPAWEITDWNVCRVYSSDDDDAAYRPVLEVVYAEGGGASIVPHVMHYARLRRG